MAPELLILQISDVAKLLRATRFTLDRLIRRCKIRSAVRRPKWSRAVFTVEDVGILGLAYWLYRSGLRIKAIQDVLEDRQIDALSHKLTDPDAFEEEADRTKFLVTWRVPKSSSTSKKQYGQRVVLVSDFDAVRRTVEESNEFGLLLVPFGRLVRELAVKLRAYIQQVEQGDRSRNRARE
jgi:hypothetical protein